MIDTPLPQPDPCDRLVPGAPAACTEAARHALLLRTTRVLRQRRRLKQAALLAALAACYAAGVLSVPQATSPIPDEIEAVAPAITEKAAASTPLAEVPAKDADVPADVLERLGLLVSEEKRSDLYRRAGDRYLEDAGDLESALRCYSRSLDAGQSAEAAVSAEDSWLLMILKDARQKEKRHAQNDG